MKFVVVYYCFSLIYEMYCGIFAQTKNCGVITGSCMLTARKQRQRKPVFYAVRADDRLRDNEIRHVTAMQQLQCNRRTVFYANLTGML
jgi:hypothetical protein